MKSICSILLLAATLLASAARPDGYTRSAIKNIIKAGQPDDSVAVFLRLEQGAIFELPDDIELMSECGNIMIVKGKAASINSLSNEAEIKEIRMPRKLYFANDIARSATGADIIHNGLNDAGIFDGTGVITGIFDSGFDLRHPAFLSTDGKSRVERIFHYTNMNGACTDYSTPMMIQAFITDSSDDTHGTHVLGTMAGGNTGVYDGMAPASTPIVACGPLYDVNIADGITRIANLAEESGRPCVINLSLSDETGPHDGSDPMARLLSELSKKAIIVISAGNSAGTCASISRTIDGDDNTIKTFIHPSVTWTHKLSGACGVWSSDNIIPEMELVLMDWKTGKEYTRIPINPDEEVSALVTDDYTGYAGSFAKSGQENFNAAFTDSFVAVYPTQAPSGRAGYIIEFTLNNTERNISWTTLAGLSVKGADGQRIDMNIQGSYCEFNAMGVPGWTTGGNYISVNSMGCGDGPIVVGAWSCRTSWEDINGNLQNYPDYTAGEVAPFSSYATLPSGRTLPHCIAPGAALVSAMSTPFHDAHPESYSVVASSISANRKNYWMADQGTSMSAPVVAGGIAMWLQADPNLTSADIREIIRATSKIDDALQNTPPAKYGAGKFDALAGLRLVLDRKASIGTIDIPSEIIIEQKEPHVYELFLAGADGIEARVYNLAGACILSSPFTNGRATIDARNCRRGIYILRAGNTSRKILF